MARDFTDDRRGRPGHDGCRHRGGVRRNGYTVVGVEVDDDAVERGRQHLEHSTARAVSRGKLSEEEAAGAARPGQLRHLARGARGRRPRGRGGRGVDRDQEGDLQAARGHRAPRTPSSPPTPRRCRSPRSRRPTPSPGRVIGVHFFNPAPVQGFVEIVQTVVTEPERARGRLRRWCRRSARTPSCAATRPASSPTRCCSATSTTRCRCTSTATPPARTSTRRCASAAATRWARWRCST